MTRITRWLGFWAGIIWLLLAARRASRRRADRESALDVARRVREKQIREAVEVHDRRFLEWLDGQFDSKGRAR